MQVFRNFVDSAFHFAVDSKYGLGALHTVPPWLVKHALHAGFETRAGQMLLSLGLPALYVGTINKKRDAQKLTGFKNATRCGLLIGVLQCSWTTRLFTKPIDSALFKGIVARSFVSTLDLMALSSTLISACAKKKKKVGWPKFLLGASWLTFRLTDLWLGKNQMAYRLAHLDAAPVQALGNQIRGWFSK